MIVHDNRWLAIIGIPLAIAGSLVAVGPWLIDDARNSDAWPILVVGSLIGSGILVAGLSLCFKYGEIEADRSMNKITRRAGTLPFRRTRSWSLEDISEIACVIEKMARTSGTGSSIHYCIRLIGPNTSVLIASSLEREPIEAEAARWATSLDKPLGNTMNPDGHSQLQESPKMNRPPSI